MSLFGKIFILTYLTSLTFDVINAKVLIFRPKFYHKFLKAQKMLSNCI